MPSKTPKQARFMAMCATPVGRAKAKKACPSHAAAKEYHEADLKSPNSKLRGKPKGVKKHTGRKK